MEQNNFLFATKCSVSMGCWCDPGRVCAGVQALWFITSLHPYCSSGRQELRAGFLQL